MNLYFIRHGRQSSSLCNVNVDLSNEGREQAQLLAKRFKDCPVDVIYSSNLIRAVQTAEYMMDYHHVEHIIREDLKEIDVICSLLSLVSLIVGVLFLAGSF